MKNVKTVGRIELVRLDLLRREVPWLWRLYVSWQDSSSVESPTLCVRKGKRVNGREGRAGMGNGNVEVRMGSVRRRISADGIGA